MARNPYKIASGGVGNGIDDPFELMETLVGKSKKQQPGLPPFTGGAIGYFGYDLLKYAEPCTQLVKERGIGGRDFWFGFYQEVLAFDRKQKEIWLLANATDSQEGGEKLDALEQWSQTGISAPDPESVTGRNRLESNFGRDEYINAVQKVREYIEAGDCYQANISQKFSMPATMDSKTVYLRLRNASPAPFGAYIDTGDRVILSSSPERFFSLAGKKIQTRPIKGTRPRGSTSEEDDSLKEELVTSEKERAENIMIVDLLRNDLAKVCKPGSVKVTGLCEIESFPTITHLISTVVGELRDESGLAELLRATFPCGSVTGAPKIRAMEIIDEIEPEPRGVYCGAIGYLGFGGSVDLSVAIRVIVKEKGRYSFHVGGGVTYPSDPAAEFNETLHKAEGIMTALSACRS